MTQTPVPSGKCSGMKDRPLCAGWQGKGAIPAKSKEKMEKAEPWWEPDQSCRGKINLCAGCPSGMLQVRWDFQGALESHPGTRKTSSVKGGEEGSKEIPRILSFEVVSFPKSLQTPGKYSTDGIFFFSPGNQYFRAGTGSSARKSQRWLGALHFSP